MLVEPEGIVRNPSTVLAPVVGSNPLQRDALGIVERLDDVVEEIQHVHCVIAQLHPHPVFVSERFCAYARPIVLICSAKGIIMHLGFLNSCESRSNCGSSAPPCLLARKLFDLFGQRRAVHRRLHLQL